MLRALVGFSLRFRVVVLVLAGLLLAAGFYVVSQAKFDVFPDFVQPQVVVQTECPGLAPEQVELLVTLPVETTINGLGDMESLRSESIQGLSIVTAVFREGTDVFRARQMLAEKLAETAGELPVGVKTPRLTPLTSSTMDLLKVGLVSDRLSAMDLRTFADWTLKPRMLSVPGVAKCSVFGGDVRQLQIQVRPERLVAHGLALTDVLEAARASSAVLGAGFVETRNQRIVLQTEGQSLTPQGLGEVMITSQGGSSVRLRDVANVVEAAEPKFGDTVIMGRPGVLLTMSSQYGANTLEVTHAVEAALDEMKPILEREGIRLYPRLHRPATFIEVALRNMQHSLVLGGVLVAVVLFLLLGSFRTAAISLTAIPLSLFAAVIVMQRLGITINTITLGGLVIALGEVVDDSIIDVENIFRRLRENGALIHPRSALEVVFDASLEVRSAVVYATFIVALVFVPVLTLSGLQGSFFAPLALSYILAILASLLVALTLTPALSLLLFSGGVRQTTEPALQRWLKSTYQSLLIHIAKRPGPVLVLILVAVVAAILRLPAGQGGFLPAFREGHFVLQVFAAPGTSLPEMLRLGTRISEALLRLPQIATVEQQVGRAELGEDPWGPHRSEFHIDLHPLTPREEEAAERDIRDTLARFPGIQFELLTFLDDRIGETLAGETAPVVVSLFGDDLDVLDVKAREVARVLSDVPGSADVHVKSPPGAPRLVIRLRPDRVAELGFRPVDVLDAVQTAFQGAVVAQTHRGREVTSVAVILDEAERREPEGVGALELRNAAGLRVRLRELTDLESASGRFSILHEGARRRQTITCGTSGRDVTSFVAEAKREVAAKVALPGTVYAAFSGAAEARARAERELLLHSAGAGVGILILLGMVFRQVRNLMLVLVNLPFALVGGVLAVAVAPLLGGDAGMTIGSLVGFVTLFGITTRNSIMMISHFEHLVTVEGRPWSLETALRGASERLMPILITATVTALGLLPLALGSGAAGREIEGPMAIVILGGLLTSTLLNLLVLPTLALRWGAFGSPPSVQAS
ncbi:MAG: efflux RND transporter permease subunit [Verrucomicrobiales bacterium]|nr:efflux RND transporter permease subunit [Verrucomicrobiales bacterium]